MDCGVARGEKGERYKRVAGCEKEESGEVNKRDVGYEIGVE
jgi:hypothetical protein